MDRSEARESGYLYASTADLIRFLKESDAPTPVESSMDLAMKQATERYRRGHFRYWKNEGRDMINAELGTCKTCKWWDKRTGLCQSDKLIAYGVLEQDGLLAESECCTRTPLITTGENFGCIHWEGKDADHP